MKQLLILLLFAGRLLATDVGFWNEYAADPRDSGSTYLLLQFEKEPMTASLGPISAIENMGKSAIVEGGRFGKALRLDGQSGLRCITTKIFEGGQVSLEAWVKLERYPEKEACIIYRPAVVDQNQSYNPQVDRSKGFALLVDVKGALHLEVVNIFYGTRTRTSTEAGAVPIGKWVHVAGVSGPGRKLYIDGQEVVNKAINWGQGLSVQGEKELEAQPIFVGNNAKGDAGLTGMIDQVRAHRNVQKFWAPEDDAWTDAKAERKVVDGPDCFVTEHLPMVQVGLDGNKSTLGKLPAKVELRGNDFRPGVHGQGFAGRVSITGSNLFRAEEGSLEFWLRPLGVNNLSDQNWAFVNEPFIFYLFNGGEHEPTLYFNVKDEGLHFVHAPMEVHPARWYHFVFTWRGKDIRIYCDGRLAGHTTTQKLAPDGRVTANRFVLNDGSRPSLLDEIRIYDRALLPEEAANAFWRYRDAAKLQHGVSLPSVQFVGEYLPSHSRIYYQLLPLRDTTNFASLRFQLVENGRVLCSQEEPWDASGLGHLLLPKMTDGPHSIKPMVVMKQGEAVPGEEFVFYERRFPWENNQLGITEEVFLPFTPVKVNRESVEVVSRAMKMNAFGLWEEAVSLGRNLLAAGMTVRFEMVEGTAEPELAGVSLKVTEQRANRAVYESKAHLGRDLSPGLLVRTRSTIEVDGCMKVNMMLGPNPRGSAATLKRLWIEIPLRDSEAPLMHTIGDGLRNNYSGATPAGQGVIWDGSKAARSQPWRNAFVPYLWLGGAERGLTFFAENDKGWVTEKNKTKTPTHELRREGDRLTLRVYLINKQVLLQQAHEIVFGLQLSPSKPMPADWRKQVAHAPGGLAVVPWGGIQCASQGPFGDDWNIVDKILEVRNGKALDAVWFSNYVGQFNPPKVHNDSDWMYYINHFVQRAKDVGPNRPLAVYQEEMRAAHSRPEWVVFQDEWKTSDGPAARTSYEGLDLRGGHRSFSGISEINFTRSYADFGTWMAHEWLKRGVSLYWDNTYLYPSFNTRLSAAYLAEDGHIQPALTIWNVREYHQRVWHVLQQCRRNRPEPLEWTLHMTNTEPLPVQTWGTVQLDHELARKNPFSPEWLMTETIGRQVGNLPLSLYEVTGRDNERIKKLPKEQRDRIEWAMRAVHEIQRSGPAKKMLTNFGYGEDSVTIHNYWADKPVLSVSPSSVKWLALSKGNEMLVVLASWSEEAVTAEVTVDGKAAGVEANANVSDAETGEKLAGPLGFRVPLGGPWGNRILRVGR